MENLSDERTLEIRVFVICWAILVVKMWYVGVKTGLARRKTLFPAAPEDAQLFYKIEEGEPEKYGERTVPLEVYRFQRAHSNDLENIPAYFIASVALYLVGANYILSMVCNIVFTVARVLYTISYQGELQPWRTFSFTIGTLTTFVALGSSIVYSLI